MYTPLHVHTDYSILDGLSKPAAVVKRCQQIGATACALTDHGSISGAVSFSNTLHKNNIKPILGCELYVGETDEEEKINYHLVLLAKNLNGWKQLIQIVSTSNLPSNFYKKPRLTLQQLSTFITDDLICVCGHPGSIIAESIINADRMLRATSSINSLLNIDGGISITKELREYFGSNLFMEIQCIDSPHSPQLSVFNHCLRHIAKELKIRCVATPDAHYCTHEDAIDQRVLLANQLKTTLPKIAHEVKTGNSVVLEQFFKYDNYHIPTLEEMVGYGNTLEELENTTVISEMCEDYDITRKPELPQYATPNGETSGEYLRKLCREGFLAKRELVNESMRRANLTLNDYGKRFEHEYGVLTDAKLADYFLIVHDIINYAKSLNMVMAPGRGSAAGSLILYMLDATQVDPLEHKLIFERFYNAGRNSADHISLPDVDMDFEIRGRGKVIDYISERFGHEKVAQMITFGRMQGRSALKDVLRAKESCSPEVMDMITKNIPNETEISDHLQEMKEQHGEASIIEWALENRGQEFSEWCSIDGNRLVGPFAKEFEQAIRLEGTKRSMGKHPAGVIIANEPLATICPMVRSAGGGEVLCGLELSDLEKIGCVKFDILGTAVLDKIHIAMDLINNETLVCET